MSEQPTPNPITDIDALLLLLYLEAWSHRVAPHKELDRVSRFAAVAKTLRDVEGLQSGVLNLFACEPTFDMTKTKAHLKLVFSADKPKADE